MIWINSIYQNLKRIFSISLFIFIIILNNSCGDSELIDYLVFQDSEVPQVLDSDYHSVDENYAGLKLLQPNGGEEWEAGSTQSILWNNYNYNIYGSVVLSYSCDGGNDWFEISSYTSNDGSYDWTVSNTYTTQSDCLIKVENYCSSSWSCDDYYDISNAPFTIIDSNEGNSIYISSPNGGEIFNEGSTQNINWSTDDIGGNTVRIAYSLDGGLTWRSIWNGYLSYNPPHESWQTTGNDGHASWSIPNITDTVETGLIGIWGPNLAEVEYYDVSDDYFTIIADSNYYRILSPNGGEELNGGSYNSITWESSGDVGSVKIYYSEYGGSSWYLIDDNEVNDGHYSWLTPQLQGDNSNILIKIEDRNNSEWFDISDNTFSIVQN